MSNLSPWGTLAGRIAGKWQLPLLGVSLFTLPLAIYCLRPNPQSMPLSQVAELMAGFVSAGAYEEAANIGRLVMDREDCRGAAGAAVHLQMARAVFGVARQTERQTANAGRTISEHYRQASLHEAAFQPEDYVKLGRALEWGKQYTLALEWFEKARANGYADELGLLRHTYLLRRDRLKALPEELSLLLDQFLASAPPKRLDMIAWALEERLGLLAAVSEEHQAAALLAPYEERFAGSDFENLFAYFGAWTLFHSGKNRDAELALRAMLNRVPTDDAVNARAAWLLGRTVMTDGTPARLQEALSFFRGVFGRHRAGAYTIASRLGAAEALALLGEHVEAAELYQFAIEDLEHIEFTGVADRNVLRASLAVMAEKCRQAGDLKAAVTYAQLVEPLVDWGSAEPAVAHLEQLAKLQAERAEQIAASDAAGSPEAARQVFADAAATYLKLAGFDIHNEERSAEAAWRAAELATRAGERNEAIDLYRIFAESRPSNPLVPRALLRIGQLHQAAGRLTEAITVYQECYRRFPKLLDGIRSLVPMAQCYVLRDPDDLELAEKTLRIILNESEVFTPEAPEFADALFLLGDVLERRGQYEEAIATLNEAIDRYPKDSRVSRARFLLADSYRQSAMALKADALGADRPGSADRIREEADARFAAARRAYRELIDEYELRRASDLSDLEKVYLRHAYLYEADCYFEARLYSEALGRYDQAAGLLRGSTSVLAAYVQIINCHVFLGQTAEARAALARAQILAERMPPDSFAVSISPETKENWKEYFAWLERAEIF